MLVHRKNMIRVTVGWTNQFIMNNPEIQMSEGDVLSTDWIQQNQRRTAGGDPSKVGCSTLSSDATTSFPQKSLGQSLPGASSKAANWVHLEQPSTAHKTQWPPLKLQRSLFARAECWQGRAARVSSMTTAPFCLPFLIPAPARNLSSVFFLLLSSLLLLVLL